MFAGRSQKKAEREHREMETQLREAVLAQQLSDREAKTVLTGYAFTFNCV